MMALIVTILEPARCKVKSAGESWIVILSEGTRADNVNRPVKLFKLETVIVVVFEDPLEISNLLESDDN